MGVEGPAIAPQFGECHSGGGVIPHAQEPLSRVFGACDNLSFDICISVSVTRYSMRHAKLAG